MAKLKGFSLIEISIILLVIAFITGGVLFGNSLVHKTQLQKVVAEIGAYEQAVTLFAERFKYMPGDFPDAVTILSSASTNGDGDWQIETAESGYVWEHLYLAGLMEFPYAGSATLAIGDNLPPSVIYDGGYWLFYYTAYGYSANALNFAGYTSGTEIKNAALSVKDAYWFDKKLDDGDADSGYLYVIRGEDVKLDAVCVDGLDTEASVEYLLSSDKDLVCRLAMWYERRKL